MSGHLIFYLGLDVATAGLSTSVVTRLAHMFLKVMVGVHTLVLLARTSRRHIVYLLLVRHALFRVYERITTLIISAVILVVTVLRLNQVRPTLRLIGTGAGVTVLLLLFVVVYRNQLGLDPDAFWSSPFAMLASSTDIVGANTRQPVDALVVWTAAFRCGRQLSGQRSCARRRRGRKA